MAGGEADADPFRDWLLPGERIVWSGRPAGGVIFTRRDIFLIPFSLLWCGFAILWTGLAAGAAVFSHRADVAGFPLFGLIFVAIGLYFVAGRFAVDALLRKQVRYALTDRRALISRAGPLAHFTAISLDRLADSTVSERADRSGNIRFGQPISLWGRQGFGVWSPALDPTPQFLAIPDARKVFDLIQAHQVRR